MLSPVQIDYDPSNGSWNVFYIEVWNSESDRGWNAQPWAFQSLGHAMSFLQPQLEKPMKQDKPGGIWEGELKAGNAFNGQAARIQQLVMVFNNEPKRPNA